MMSSRCVTESKQLLNSLENECRAEDGFEEIYVYRRWKLVECETTRNLLVCQEVVQCRYNFPGRALVSVADCVLLPGSGF